MTLPTFTIDTDPAHEFLHLTLTGDWDVAITARFAIAVAQALRDMAARGARPGHFRTLIDMREKNILPQNVAAEFAKMVRPDSPSRRIAMLASSALHAFQARRLSDDRRRVFSDEGEAIVWLFEGLPLPPALRALHGAC